MGIQNNLKSKSIIKKNNLKLPVTTPPKISVKNPPKPISPKTPASLPKKTVKLIPAKPLTKIPPKPPSAPSLSNSSPQKIEKGEIVVLIAPNQTYNQDMIKLCKNLVQTHNKICYVTLNKLFKSQIKILEKNEIDSKKFYFVDTMTKPLASEEQQSENCTFVSSLNALTELNIAIVKVLEEQKFDAILFDSISTLLVYNPESDAEKFIHNLVGKIRAAECTGIFVFLEGDKNSIVLKDVGMFVDKTINGVA